MTPFERAQIQKRVLESIRASVPSGRPTNGSIAEAAGCDRSEITRFEAGERKLDLDEVIGLCDRYGADAVLGPIAEMFGFQVASAESAEPAGDIARSAAHLTASSASYSVAVHEALADGLLTEDEADSLERRKMELHAETRRMCLRRVRAGRVA